MNISAHEFEEAAVTCPKCGFVSFPDLSECRKCGHRFAAPEQPEAAPNPEASQRLASSAASDEMSERVAGFRRRRATLRDDAREASLVFDFPATTAQLTPSEAIQNPAQISPAERRFNQVFSERASSRSQANLESIRLSPLIEEGGNREAKAEAFGSSFNQVGARDSRAIQFGEIPFAPHTAASGQEFPEVVSAPLGSRLAAGLIDSLVLTVSGCLFVILFMAAGGRFSKTAVGAGVALFIIAFWLFIYFTVFGVMTRRTPGQDALGLKLCNLDGEPPTGAECLWRAFGYLVSISALTVGLVWTALDSDGMGWHDHISGTLPCSIKRPG